MEGPFKTTVTCSHLCDWISELATLGKYIGLKLALSLMKFPFSIFKDGHTLIKSHIEGVSEGDNKKGRVRVESSR